MAALGLWLWSNPQSFGTSDSTCATEFASLAILGARVQFGSEPLRIFSLVLYSLFLLPGFNLLLPMVVFLGFFIWHHTHHRQEIAQASERSESPQRTTGFTTWLQEVCAKGIHSSVFPVWAGLIFLLAINIVFIIDIELTLHRNRDLQASGETEWGFGQVLAVLLLFMPLRDLVEMILARRQRRQEEQISAHEWREAILLGDAYKILVMVKVGADPNVKASGERIVSLSAVTYRRVI